MPKAGFREPSSHESHTSESNERLVDADDPLDSTGDQRGAWSFGFLQKPMLHDRMPMMGWRF